MTNVFFSASTLGFYPAEDQALYEEAGSWPTDAKLLVDPLATLYWKVSAPPGKQLGANSAGEPVWVDPPAPSPEEVLITNSSERDRLLGIATLAIAPLQDALDLEDAKDEDIALLKSWKQYRVAVNRVLLNNPLPVWPEQP
ncbi:tail fiber assembly protein [Pseudomonas folii]|uniref:Tail fiber assembly protein n=1 Tax=Pseudomonas folii TaxID=2762593 RepID=A0ABR7B4W7_9PSED|nr:tail fiber assembly protein [Pseudomonas folii]MBC3952194.1 tail fiber assembly protein [Pseudomonas folii]